MGVDLHWENERGELLGGVDDPRNLVVQLVAVANPERSRCLRFIDPYGDTYFNQMQIPVFEEEIRSLSSGQLSAEAEAHREEIMKLIASAKGQVHTYLKFYGD